MIDGTIASDWQLMATTRSGALPMADTTGAGASMARATVGWHGTVGVCRALPDECLEMATPWQL